MIVVDSVAALREAVGNHRRRGARIGFVPTMGNLHAGHLRLVEEARRRADIVVVSIYVNPLQFGPTEDLAAYPRTPEDDRRRLEALSVDILFMPTDREMYPRGIDIMTRVEVPNLGAILCGASRPTHFAGVTTVVNRLFNLVGSDIAVFGKKDYQQLLIIRRMVSDLGMPIEIVGVDTVREVDGLAMSSRNGYLAAGERQIAPMLYRTIQIATEYLDHHEESIEAAQIKAGQELAKLGFRVDYVEVRRRTDLAFPDADDHELVMLAAAWLGQTRLIDNIEFNRLWSLFCRM